jgi:hypothetical protein
VATLAPAALRWLAQQWDAAIPSAQNSGIVGDLAHAREGGYHISREDQPSSNYSCVLPEDRRGPSNLAAAIDETMNERDMALVSRRLLNSAKDQNDPRLNWCRAFNGWLGSGEAFRYDTYHQHQLWATPDHKWHVHLEVLREHVNNMQAMRDILSVVRGESVEQWRSGGGRAESVQGEDDMPSAADVWNYPVPRPPASRVGEDKRTTIPAGEMLAWTNAATWMLHTLVQQVTKTLSEQITAVGKVAGMSPQQLDVLRAEVAKQVDEAEVNLLKAVREIPAAAIVDEISDRLGNEA